MDVVPVSPNSLQWGAVLGASLFAAVWDIRTGTIPNRLTGPLVLLGLAFSFCQGSWAGLGESVLSCLLLGVPFVLLFAIGGGGAGDAKLMGAIGAWLPLQAGAVVLVAVVLTGGVLALLRILAHRQRLSLLANLGRMIYVFLVAVCSGRRGFALLRTDTDESEEAPKPGVTMPYGPAIFIGVCIGAVWVHVRTG